MRKVFLDEIDYNIYHNTGIYWKGLIGKTLRFIYDDIYGDIYIKDYIKGKLLIIYKDVEFIMKTNSILHAELGNVVSNIFVNDPKKELIQYIIDDYETIKNYTINSRKYVNVKCPCCDTIKKIIVYQLFSNKSISCPVCGRRSSYPERFMCEVLAQLNVDFQREIKLKISNKIVRYDFYVPKFNILIETDGTQHFDIKNSWYRGNDVFKDNIAIKNNFNLIRIDCRYSNTNYIKESILKSNLKKYFDLSNVNWNTCDKKASKSIITQIANDFNNGIVDLDILAKKYFLCRKTVREYLYKANDIGLCEFDSNFLKEKRREKLKKKNIERCSKKIKALKNGKCVYEFDSVSELCRQFSKIFNMKFDSGTVCAIANHKHGKKTYHGFTFEYV